MSQTEDQKAPDLVESEVDSEYEYESTDEEDEDDSWTTVATKKKEAKYSFGGKKFFNGKAVLKHARSIRDHHSSNEPFQSEFLMELLKVHPNAEAKMGVGVKEFFVAPAPNHPDNRCFWLTRTDGSQIDFSIRACVNY